MSLGRLVNRGRWVRLLEKGIEGIDAGGPVLDGDDAAVAELEDADFSGLDGESGDESGVITEDDAMGVFSHLGECEGATDAGHAVDVGEIDGLFVR